MAGTYRDALRARQFSVLAGATLISMLGDTAAYLAVTVLVYQRTGSALLSALTFVVAFVPYLFGGTLLSGLVDRLPARQVMIGADLIGAGLVAVIAIPAIPIATIYLALFVIGTMAPVRSGTVGALVAKILPEDAFVPGRSILRIISQVSQIVGAAAGGALIAPIGPRGALLADTASFIISATMIGVAITPSAAAGSTRTSSLISDSLAGLRDVWTHRSVRQLLLLGWLVPFVAVAPEGLAAPAVAQSHHSQALVGLWLAAIPVGTVLGDVIAVWTVPSRHRKRLIWPLALALPAVMIVFAAHPPLAIAIVILVLSGAASAYGLGVDQTLRDITPQALLARMYTLNSTGLMVVQGIGFAVAGALGDYVKAADVIAVEGVAGVIAVAVLGTRRART